MSAKCHEYMHVLKIYMQILMFTRVLYVYKTWLTRRDTIMADTSNFFPFHSMGQSKFIVALHKEFFLKNVLKKMSLRQDYGIFFQFYSPIMERANHLEDNTTSGVQITLFSSCVRHQGPNPNADVEWYSST